MASLHDTFTGDSGAVASVPRRTCIAHLLQLWNTPEQCIDWCQEHGLFSTTVICSRCCGECNWVTHSGGDGFVWRCKSRSCQRRCSLRVGTLFESSKLSLSLILQIIYWWCRGMSVQQTVVEVGVSKVTIIDWYQRLRAVCADYLILKQEPVGGPGRIVEIDETKIGHRKYNRGRLRDGVWVFGALDTTTNDIVLSVVQDRSADTLIPVIQRLIRPGSTIMSDQWAAYNSLEQYGYEHYTVNHSTNFVDPVTGANTQRIESAWAQAKSKIKHARGVHHEYMETYLVEFLWRRKYGGEQVFENFIKHAGSVFAMSE